MERSVTKNQPFPYQESFATVPELPILNVATEPETATTVLGWLWRRRYADEAIRAKRPKTGLLSADANFGEQTHAEVEGWL